MIGAGKKLAAIALLGLCCAGGIGASAATPGADTWTADPEAQFLLDVQLRSRRLGDGVRAYDTPTGTCIMFGDFLNALDVPMKIDFPARKAVGWAFKEDHRISIDASSGVVTYGKTTERMAPGAVRETPDGWCVDASSLTKWFGIAVKPNTKGSALVLESEAKLPIELAIERERRAAQIKPAKFDLSTLPSVKLPYRMWRAPALDFVVNAGVTYRAQDGVRVDRSTSISAAGEIAHLSYDARDLDRLQGRAEQSAVAGVQVRPGSRPPRTIARHSHSGSATSRGSIADWAALRSVGAAQSSPIGRCSIPPPSTRRASKATFRRGGKPSSTATANCSRSPGRRAIHATSSRTCSCCTAKTRSASCSTVHKAKSGHVKS